MFCEKIAKTPAAPDPIPKPMTPTMTACSSTIEASVAFVAPSALSVAKYRMFSTVNW